MASHDCLSTYGYPNMEEHDKLPRDSGEQEGKRLLHVNQNCSLLPHTLNITCNVWGDTYTTTQDFLFHQSAITDNNPGPHPSEWLCETERSGGSSDFVSSHTVSRGVEMGEMDILPEDPTDHLKKKKEKKRGVITLSYTHSI